MVNKSLFTSLTCYLNIEFCDEAERVLAGTVWQFELVATGVGVGVEVSQEVGLDHSGATGCT